jgi:hypothetical protein
VGLLEECYKRSSRRYEITIENAFAALAVASQEEA